MKSEKQRARLRSRLEDIAVNLGLRESERLNLKRNTPGRRDCEGFVADSVNAYTGGVVPGTPPCFLDELEEGEWCTMCQERKRIKADYAAKSAECRKLRARLMRIARHWRPE